MKVILAKTAGFCFGVKRAVDMVYEQIEKSQKPIYTIGPIIHNEQVVKDFENKGVMVLDSKGGVCQAADSTIIIRSHGVDEETYHKLEENHNTIVDATCPFVKKIHRIVKEESEKGRYIIIIGNASHPEVEGIKGWAGEHVMVLDSMEEAEKISLPKTKKLSIVSQTTFNYNKFKNLVEIISKKGYDINVLDTICNATHERQKEAREIAGQVDAMIVIGGKHSSNTQKLYDICHEKCENTYYIQTLGDLDLCQLQPCSCVGITAGASTPNNIIEEVHTHVRAKF